MMRMMESVVRVSPTVNFVSDEAKQDGLRCGGDKACKRWEEKGSMLKTERFEI